MSTSTSIKVENGGGNKDQTEKIALSSDTNGSSGFADKPSSMPVEDFLSCLAKHKDINKVTVETADRKCIIGVVKDKVVELTYHAMDGNMNGDIAKTAEGSVSGMGMTTSLPPKKRPKHEDGPSLNPMSILVSAAATQASVDVATKKKATKRKPRKIIPENKVYVVFTEKDVLFGRGGRSNHHPGNKKYRDIVTSKQDYYRSCDKNQKTQVAQKIVDDIQKNGGRFLELDRDAKQWFLVPNVVARRKVGQALRENNTEEARAAKRAKYQNNMKKNKNSPAPGDFKGVNVPLGIANNDATNGNGNTKTATNTVEV